VENVSSRLVDRFQSFSKKSQVLAQNTRQSDLALHVVGSWAADEGEPCRTSGRLADISCIGSTINGLTDGFVTFSAIKMIRPASYPGRTRVHRVVISVSVGSDRNRGRDFNATAM
jgi:hypothetical protein